MKKGFIAALATALLVSAAAAYGATRTSNGPDRAAAPAAAGTTAIKCGRTRLIGFLAPVTGPAASLGGTQVSWVKYYVSQFNKANKNRKFKLVTQDTMLGTAQGSTETVKGAQAVTSNSKILAVIGPAGSNEVKAATATFLKGKIAFITGSATATELTADGTRNGFFFRTVPPDAVQSTNVANFLNNVRKVKRVYIIDDQEAYSTGLADAVQAKLRAAGVTVTRDGVSQQQSDFSSLIAKIPRNTQVVYLPWQLPPKAKAFGQQMQQSGRGNIDLMGSDGLYDPDFSGLGKNIYTSFFPVKASTPIIGLYKAAHGGKADFFGAPSYVSAQVVGGAINRACKDGKATRAEVRAQIKKTRLKTSLLGYGVRFNARGDTNPAAFGIWKSVNGQFVPYS
jgi:branched-chain amino acid transport system substrate-binding protein